MTWVDLGQATVVATALLILPGLPAAVVTGLRGMWCVGASVPLSAAVVTVSAFAAPILGWEWSLLPVALFTVLLALGAGVCRLALRRWWKLGPRGAEGASREWFFLAAVVVGALVLTWQLTRALGAPGNISQTFDAIYHLNAVRWIMDTSDASPSGVAEMASDTLGFYPAGFHGFAALTTELTGVEIAVGVNATWLAFAVVAWPLGIVLMTRVLVGPNRVAMIAAGLLSAALPAFPYLLVYYGVLYPLLAAYAVLPAALAVALRAIGVGAEDPNASKLALPWVLLTMVTVPGIALLHPTALVSWLVLVSAWVVIAGVRLIVSSTRLRHRVGWAVVLVAWLLAVLVATRILRPPADATRWRPAGTMAEALGEVALLAVEKQSIPLIAVIVLWAGIYWVARSPQFRLDQRLALWAGPVVFALLYVMVAGVSSVFVRDNITASWYNNSPRIAALLPLVAVPVGAVGMAWLWELMVGWGRSERPQAFASSRRVIAIGLIGVVVATMALQGRAVGNALRYVTHYYAMTERPELLSIDEHTLLERLDQSVPPDAVIAGNPWNGSSLAYAIADRPVLYPHILSDIDEDTELLTEHLRDARPGNEVCAAARRLNVKYLLDFGSREVQDIGPHDFDGFRYPASSGAFELVDEEGTSRLYRLTACG